MSESHIMDTSGTKAYILLAIVICSILGFDIRNKLASCFNYDVKKIDPWNRRRAKEGSGI